MKSFQEYNIHYVCIKWSDIQCGWTNILEIRMLKNVVELEPK